MVGRIFLGLVLAVVLVALPGSGVVWADPPRVPGIGDRLLGEVHGGKHGLWGVLFLPGVLGLSGRPASGSWLPHSYPD